MMNGGKNMKETAMVGFSEGIVTEILLRLPVKSLLTFKRVCKSWYSIISSAMFVREHLKRAHAACYNQHKNFLGIRDAYSPCLWFKEDSDGVMLVKEFDFPTNNLAGPEEKIFPWACNSCDGIICFQMVRANTVVLWNPSLPTEYEVIDTSCFTDVGNCGIAYDPCTDDYKIVNLPYYSVDDTPCAYITFQNFSLNRDSWRILRIAKTRDFQIKNTKVVYTKNRLHWLVGDYQYEIEDDGDDDNAKIEDITLFMAYFDLVEESLDFLNLPSSSDRFAVPLNYKESLGIACRNPDGEEEFWILQDYCGLKCSWSKLFKVSCSYSWPMDYCFTLKGELLVCDENGLSIVDPNDGSLEDVVCEGDDIGDYDEEDYVHTFTTPYVESLVSPVRLK